MTLVYEFRNILEGDIDTFIRVVESSVWVFFF